MAQSIKNMLAAVLISISGFLFWTQALPAYELNSILKDSISVKQELLNARTEIVQKIENLKTERSTRYSEIQRLSLVVPKTKSLPEIISTIDAMFSQSGLALGDFVLSDSALKEGLRSINIGVSSVGTYENLTAILSVIEKNIRLFDINNLSISESSGATGGSELDFEMKGDIYWFSEPEDKSSTSTAPTGDSASGE